MRHLPRFSKLSRQIIFFIRWKWTQNPNSLAARHFEI